LAFAGDWLAGKTDMLVLSSVTGFPFCLA
jgi:hypothetical protein